MRLPRLFRFRLRTLLALIALASLVLGWYAANARQYATELAVLNRLRDAMNGTNGTMLVVRDGEGVESGAMTSDPIQAVSATKRWIGPTWLRPLLTRLHLPIRYRVTELTFYMPCPLSDDDFQSLAVLRDVEDVQVINLSSGTPSLKPDPEPIFVQHLREVFPQANVQYSHPQ